MTVMPSRLALCNLREALTMKRTLASLSLALVLTLPAFAQQSDAELDALMPQLSNWGRWGSEDQLGTLNHLTDAHRLKAAGRRTVSLARSVPMLATNLREGAITSKNTSTHRRRKLAAWTISR